MKSIDLTIVTLTKCSMRKNILKLFIFFFLNIFYNDFLNIFNIKKMIIEGLIQITVQKLRNSNYIDYKIYIY